MVGERREHVRRNTHNCPRKGNQQTWFEHRESWLDVPQSPGQRETHSWRLREAARTAVEDEFRPLAQANSVKAAEECLRTGAPFEEPHDPGLRPDEQWMLWLTDAQLTECKEKYAAVDKQFPPKSISPCWAKERELGSALCYF